jgi:hypothetical protein
MTAMPRSTKPSSTTPTTAPRQYGSSIKLHHAAHNQPIALGVKNVQEYIATPEPAHSSFVCE